MLRRWLSHSCAACLRGDYAGCDKEAERSSDNATVTFAVGVKHSTGAAAGRARIKDRTEATRAAVVVGQVVALWAGDGEFAVAKVAKQPRKAQKGEVVMGQPTNHGQYWVVEVDWSSSVGSSKAHPQKVKFEVGEMCSKTECVCGAARGCKKRHSHLVYVDTILVPLDLGMVREGAPTRRQRKRQRQQQQRATKPEFWVLPPGSKQALLRTMAEDRAAGVTYTRHT